MLTRLTATLCVFSCCGCSYTAQIRTAESELLRENTVQITAHLTNEQLQIFANKELYLSMVLLECDDRREIYPMAVYIDGRPQEEFGDTSSNTITGLIPRMIYDRVRSPCVSISGGSYIRGKVSSNIVPVTPLR